jgi:thymidylate synthase (FAD)
MKIVKPYAKMLTLNHGEQYSDEAKEFTLAHGIRLLQHVEWCARISHRSEEAVTDESWKRIIQSVVLDHGDWSVTEHAVVSVDAYVDRGITHEWVRHRIASYTQESTRFVNYIKKMLPSFVKPEALKETTLRGNSEFSPNQNRDRANGAWEKAVATCEESYQIMLDCGYAPQIARSVFPNALASRLIVTKNLRTWRHFFIMRTSKEAHPQMKEVTIPLLREFQEKIPLLYADIVPDQKQSEAMKKAR